MNHFKPGKTVLLGLLIVGVLSVQKNIAQQDNTDQRNSWNYQLNEMNYLVLKASSVNIIYGLHLSTKQAAKLKSLAGQMQALGLAVPDTEGKTCKELKTCRTTYYKILDYLKEQKPLPDSLKDEFARQRMKEAEIIKRSVIGAQKSHYSKDRGCMKCHAPPEDFPGGNVSDMETRPISEQERQEIDRAHVRGIFGEKGIEKLWQLKDDVAEILTTGQQYMLKDFRCTFIPPGALKDPTNIGEAFDRNKWIGYLKEIRSHSDEYWKEYKQLYLVPVKDIIEAKLPGIRKKYKKDVLEDVKTVIREARSMDQVDFELQKDMLCSKIQNAFNIDFLIGENDRSKKERRFIAAMFLLFPGSMDIYDAIINESYSKSDAHDKNK